MFGILLVMKFLQLEEEKQRTEIAVRNTLSERKAIDKSLAAMEKENTELYRNCAQLQSQVFSHHTLTKGKIPQDVLAGCPVRARHW